MGRQERPAKLGIQVMVGSDDEEEVAKATLQLRRELLDLEVEAVELPPAGEPPPGTRAVELAAIGALSVTIGQSQLLANVVAAISSWLAGHQQRSVKLELDGDVLELTGCRPSSSSGSPTSGCAATRPGEPAMDEQRSALIVPSDDYTDSGLRRLRASAIDAQALTAVLRDPQIGGFQVRTLLNEPAYVISEAIEDFFADRRPDDLLLHLSCHGIKDEDGHLYFAAANTKLRRLGATAVAAGFVNRLMNRSRSRRVVLLLDCCYAGAFERGMTARAGTDMGIKEHFGGHGRAVITASSAMEYALEGDQLADTQQQQPSVFTSALVRGWKPGRPTATGRPRRLGRAVRLRLRQGAGGHPQPDTGPMDLRRAGRAGHCLPSPSGHHARATVLFSPFGRSKGAARRTEGVTVITRHGRAAAVVVLAVGAMLLAACGGGGGTSSHLTERGPITYVEGQDLVTAPLIAKWNSAHPDQKVTLKQQSEQADQHDDLVQHFQAKDPNYDVAIVDVVWTAEFAAKGWLQPLKDQFAVDTSAFFPAPLKTATYNNTLYALPVASDGGLLYYRKDLVPNPPKTWDEMMADCSIAKKNNMDCYAGQFAKYEGLTCNATEAINTDGGAVVGPDGKTPTVNSPEAAKGLGRLAKAYKNGNIPKQAITFQEEQSRQAFESGKLLFLRNWPYVYSLATTDASSRVKGKFGVAPLPGDNGKPGISTLGGHDVAISVYSAHKATAFDFIKFWTSEDTGRYLALQASFAPVLTKLYDDPALIKKLPYLPTLKTAIENAVPRPVSPSYPSVTRAIQDNSYAAIKGDKPVQQALTDMQNAIKAPASG